MLIFKPIDCFPKGTIFNLLSDSYLDFHNNYPEYLSENTKSFSECDTFFYEKIKIGLNCCLITVFQNLPIGMVCWDPRESPICNIGHNCIIPNHRSNGFGKEQINNALKIIAMNGFNICRVSTGLMSFFEPAKKMYLANGFKETRRDLLSNGIIKMHDMVYYELNLKQNKS